MFLLTEESYSIETLTENTNTGKKMYIEGVFAQANKKNRNGRNYPKNVLERAIDSYKTNYIDKHISIGQNEHPSYPLPKMDEAALMVESLEWHGDDVIGKAKILDNLPQGKILKGLLDENFGGGVSTRGLGDMREFNNQKMITEFVLNAIDYVSTPSGIDCFPTPMYESASGIWVPVEEKLAFNEKDFLNNFDKFMENLKKKHKK